MTITQTAPASTAVGVDVTTGNPTRIYTIVRDPVEVEVVTSHPGLPTNADQ